MPRSSDCLQANVTRIRAPAALLALALLADSSQAQTATAPREPSGDVQRWVADLRDGSGPALARAQRGLAGAGPRADASLVSAVAALLRDAEPRVRAHAAAALGSLGAGARTALPALVSAAMDSSAVVRAEVVWALGRVVRDAGEPVPALVDALVDPSPIVGLRAREAVRPLTLPSTWLGRVDALLADTARASRLAGLHVLHRLRDPALRANRFAALLQSPAPWLRAEAAWGIADVASFAAFALPRLDSLRTDADADVREAATEAAARVRAARASAPTPTPPSAPAAACSHRAVEALVPMTLTVLPGSPSLRDDGRGPYRQEAGTRSSHNYSYNLLLPYADGTIRPYRRVSRPDSARVPARTLALDLAEPVAAAAGGALGVVRDSAVQVHVFYMIDPQRVIWNFRDIPIGATVESDRTELQFSAGGVRYLLQFGPWALGACGEPYAGGGILHGAGTTSARIRRLSATTFFVEAPRGSVARLWDLRDLSRPADRGLYRVAFQLRVDQ